MSTFITVFIFLLICISIFLNIKILHNSIMEPTFIFSNIWLVFIFFANVTLDFEYNYSGIAYIIILCLTGFFVNIYVGSLFHKTYVVKSDALFNEVRSKFILFISISLGMLVPLINMKLNGFSLNYFSNFDSFLDMNNQMAVNRYSGIHKTSTMLQMLMIFAYFSPIAGGYHFAFSKDTRNKLIGMMGFLPTLCDLLIQNAKSELLSSIFLFLSANFVANIYLNKNIHLKIKNVIMILISVISVGTLLIFTMLFRLGEVTSDNFKSVLNKFLVYALGHIPTFDNWFLTYQETGNYGFGKNTFIGIFNFLGISDRVQGVYTEFILVEGFRSNIYTAFRGMIQDFGIIGSIIFFAVLMMSIAFAYHSLIRRQNVNMASFILINGYFFIFYSFIVSSWSYISYILAIFLFLPYLKFVRMTR